jgi:hypothetical protein
MSLSPRKFIIVSCLAAAALASVGRAALIWNAYDDFYLSPTAAGWGGATSPSVTGAAWGYYMGNVNGFGLPTSIGGYLTSEIYRFSSVNPLGVGGPVYSTSLWDATGGAGFARYYDNVSWGAPGDLHASLGSYSTPWFGGAPGLSQSLTNLIWMQSVWLGGGGSEGIASMLIWKAPAAGTYNFSGLFVSGDQAANGAAVAIVSPGGANLSRTVLANNSVQSFSFQSSYNAGDVVQFQVGNNFSIGNAVGLQLEIAAATIPEPSTLFAGLILGGLALWQTRRRLRSGHANATA